MFFGLLQVTLARHFLSGKYQSQNHNYSALLRQNGSLRLHHTTVNNNALEHYSSYRVVQLQCRDPSHHLSLQDSIRTTTTTTTVNSANGSGGTGGGQISTGGNGTSGANSNIIGGHHHHHHHHNQRCSNDCRSSQHRNRCASIGSKSTLLNAQIGPHAPAQHRLLQTQISQLSSVGDANSLLECDMTGGSTTSQYYPSTAYRLKEIRRQRSRGNDECHSIDSTVTAPYWGKDDNKRSVSMHETELYTKPVAPHIMAATLVATQPVQPMHSIAELSLERPTRSRLKLSRIITRRQQDPFAMQSSPRVELMRPQYKMDKTSVKTINSLADKFKWRTKRKLPKKRTPVLNKSDQYDGSTNIGGPLPTTALMKVVYTTATGAELEPELSHNNDSSLAYRTPHAL